MNDSLARYRPYLAILLLFAAVLGGTVWLFQRREPATNTITTPTPRPTPTTATILVDVRGIGDAMFEQIKDLITVQ